MWTLTFDGAECPQKLLNKVFATPDLVVLHQLNVERVGRHLAQLVEQNVSTDGDWYHFDAVVLHDVRLDDGRRQVVSSTLDQQQDRLECLATRSRRLQFDVRRLQALQCQCQCQLQCHCQWPHYY